MNIKLCLWFYEFNRQVWNDPLNEYMNIKLYYLRMNAPVVRIWSPKCEWIDEYLDIWVYEWMR